MWGEGRGKEFGSRKGFCTALSTEACPTASAHRKASQQAAEVLPTFLRPIVSLRALICSSPAYISVCPRPGQLQSQLCSGVQALAGCVQGFTGSQHCGFTVWHTLGPDICFWALGKRRPLPGTFVWAKGDQVSLWPHRRPSASQELMLQMNLLELIRKLQQRGCQGGKAAL